MDGTQKDLRVMPTKEMYKSPHHSLFATIVPNPQSPSPSSRLVLGDEVLFLRKARFRSDGDDLQSLASNSHVISLFSLGAARCKIGRRLRSVTSSRMVPLTHSLRCLLPNTHIDLLQGRLARVTYENSLLVNRVLNFSPSRLRPPDQT